MIKNKIAITSIGSISPLGISSNEIWKNYKSNSHYITEKDFNIFNALVAELTNESKLEIEKLRLSDAKYKDLDNSVLYAIYASRIAINKSGWNSNNNFGVNIGSSRGATSLFEKYHEDFLKRNKSETLASPTTTLGNISSWVAHDLQANGPEISHSITCSTALHALLNGVAWLQSDMVDKFLVGGSEAPLTSFTIAQMQALKVYAQKNTTYPCQAFNLDKDKKQREKSRCFKKLNSKLTKTIFFNIQDFDLLE